jgi:hypothetical protein
MNKTAYWMSLTKKLQLMEHQSHTSTHTGQLQEMPQQIYLEASTGQPTEGKTCQEQELSY